MNQQVSDQEGTAGRKSGAKHAYRAVVLAALPATQAQIHEKTGLGAGTICRWIKALREDGEIHIGGWVRTNGKWGAIHHPGPGKDKRAPRPKTKAEINRKRLRKARETGHYEVILAKERKRYWEKKGVQRDPVTAALFGGVTPHCQHGRDL